MKEIRTIIEKINKAYAIGDTVIISSFVTDNIIWDMKGSQMIKGRKAFDEANESMSGMEAMDMKLDNIIVDGNRASANGTLKYKDENDSVKTMVFCDVYKFTEGDKPLISEMTSYALHI